MIKTRAFRIPLVFLLLLVGAACVTNEERRLEISRLPMASVPYAFNSGLGVAEALVVRDAKNWSDVWSRLHAIRRPTPPLPEIDFEQRLVIVVAQGGKPTGGHAVEIAGATLVAGSLHIDVNLTQPGIECVVSTGLTAPVDIAVLTEFDGDVVFRESITIRECQ